MSNFRIRAPPIVFLWCLCSYYWPLSVESFALLSPSTPIPHPRMTTTRRRSALPMDSGEGSSPRFTVGVIADIQYAPIDDGYSYTGTPRFYRHSLEVTQHAFEH